MRPRLFTRVGIGLESLQHCLPCIPILAQDEYGVAVRLCLFVHRFRRPPHESREILLTPRQRLGRSLACSGGYGDASRRAVNSPGDASLMTKRLTQISTQLCERYACRGDLDLQITAPVVAVRVRGARSPGIGLHLRQMVQYLHCNDLPREPLLSLLRRYRESLDHNAARGDRIADHQSGADADHGRDEYQKKLDADPQTQSEPADIFLTEQVTQMRKAQRAFVVQMFLLHPQELRLLFQKGRSVPRDLGITCRQPSSY